MKAFIALLIDSWRELLDKRSLLVLLIAFGAIILAVSSLSFEARTIEEQLQAQSRKLHEFSAGSRGFRSYVQLEYEAAPPQAAAADADLPFTTRDSWYVDYVLKKEYELNAPILSWRSMQTYKRTRQWPAPPTAEQTAQLVAGFTEADRTGFFEERFRDFGYEQVAARRIAEEPPTWRVFVHTDFPGEVTGMRLGILFGTRKLELDDWNIPELWDPLESTCRHASLSIL